MFRSPTNNKFSQMIRSRDGNFAMLAAFLLPVTMIAGSLALDTTNALSMKARLQNAADSAALATATRLYQEENLSTADAKAFAATFFKGQVEEDSSAYDGFSVAPKVTITKAKANGGTTWQVSVAVTGTQKTTPMARLLGRDTLSVNVAGKSQSGSESAQGSISMALVLDQSGSMEKKKREGYF